MKKITTGNFITDNETNKVYVSTLIDKVCGGLDDRLRSHLKECIVGFAPSCEQLYNTKDVWARDYMPIQLTKDVFLNFTYKPDYLEDSPKYVTNWQLHHVHARKEHFDFQVVQMPIILDGGNVVKAVVGGKPYFIMCDKVLVENNVTIADFTSWWEIWWKEHFDGTEMGLVLLPWEGKADNPIGHADGMVRYIGEGCVLMTNYLDFDKRFNDDHGSKMKQVLEGVGFKVKTLDFWDIFSDNEAFLQKFNHTWSYINYLHVDNRILLPSLGYEALDNEALYQVKEAFEEVGRVVDIRLIDVDMTPIVGDMGGIHNSGGALNCLTWTILQ